MNTTHAASFRITFDPKLRAYMYLSSLAVLVVTIVGIPIVPFWIFIGWWWSGRYFESLRCELTDRRLHIHRGVFFQKDKTIMLDKTRISVCHTVPC